MWCDSTLRQLVKEKKEEIDERTYKLIERLVKNGIIEVSPIIEVGKVSYPIIEEVLEIKSFDKVNEFINILIKSGMFEHKLIDKAIRCPRCGSFSILVKYYCPYCGSIDIDRNSIISHTMCGEISSISNFRKGEKLICPRCGRELVNPEIDYKIIGEVFECNNCKRRFDMPAIMHKCATDGMTFSYREAKYAPIYLLTLSEEVFKSVVKGKYVISIISNILRENDFQVFENTALRGTSGINHQFDIVASPKNQKNSKYLCINVTSNISENDLIMMFSRIFDVKSAYGVIVGFSDILKHIQELAKSYSISIIAVKGIEDLKDKVNKYIGELKTKL